MSDKEKQEKYVILIHRDSDVSTLSEFMNKEHIYQIEPKDLFELNRDDIFSQMSIADFSNYSENNIPKSASDLEVIMTLPRPCRLRIPAKNVTKELLISQTNLQTLDTDYFAFEDEMIQSVLQNPTSSISNSNGSYSKSKIDCSVIGWFKSSGVKMSSIKTAFSTNDQLIDISDFIVNLNTFVDKNGGNFTIKLPFLALDSSGGVRIINNLKPNEDSFSYFSNKPVGYSSKEYNKTNYNSDFDYFSTLIQNNDLLFIKFGIIENADWRKNINAVGMSAFILPAGIDISNENFDMIALVDSVEVIKSSQNSEAHVEIKGRDLIKLLIDDSSNFFQTSTTNKASDVFWNAQDKGDITSIDKAGGEYVDPIKRVRRLMGEIDVFANRVNMSVSFILKGVISQLSNIEVVPGSVFKSWGDKRTMYSDINSDKKAK